MPRGALVGGPPAIAGQGSPCCRLRSPTSCRRLLPLPLLRRRRLGPLCGRLALPPPAHRGRSGRVPPHRPRSARPRPWCAAPASDRGRRRRKLQPGRHGLMWQTSRARHVGTGDST
ncbi:hypothetical protein I4F81_004494 [Pyropia yezoensis]|uniref:Uncharacterized protein n=1 Tax=Pyropia yezoensis TaxID=2788 RepID=A0ACC3BV42_PYRYE|nr:hypothetical protein I4F81_004494 [Neopyropia yezoensis]